MFAERLNPFPVRVLLMVIPQWRIVAASRLHPGDAPLMICLLYTSPSPRDVEESRMPSSA